MDRGRHADFEVPHLMVSPLLSQSTAVPPADSTNPGRANQEGRQAIHESDRPAALETLGNPHPDLVDLIQVGDSDRRVDDRVTVAAQTGARPSPPPATQGWLTPFPASICPRGRTARQLARRRGACSGCESHLFHSMVESEVDAVLDPVRGTRLQPGTFRAPRSSGTVTGLFCGSRGPM
jgi:hypothetical protein